MQLQIMRTIVIGIMTILPLSVFAQGFDHPYPRTAIWQTGGAPPDWAARFDLITIRPRSSDWVAEVRRLNPNAMILFMKDLNKAYERIDGFPAEWYLYDSHGRKIELYGAGQFWVNLSDVCPTVGGQQCVDFLPGYYADMISQVDGFSTDGIYHRLHLQYNMFEDVDMDRNGVNDLTEHGKAWVIDRWANGVDRLLQGMRTAFGDKIIILNTGSPDTPGTELVNGYISEHIKGEFNWRFSSSHFENTSNAVLEPKVFVLNNDADSIDPNLIHPTKDYFSLMRFGLVRAMLTGQYYEYEDVDFGNNEHYWNKYYDEFDLDIGQPLGKMQDAGGGVWSRFFQKGAVIANISGSSRTTSDADLRTLSGYGGPYFRFSGGQAPEVNDGRQFDSIILGGYQYNSRSGDLVTMGDAVVLLKTPQTVVSDIIIDNVEMGTSPGSKAVEFSGGFHQEEDCGTGRDYYSVRCSWNPGTFPYTVSFSGPGEAIYMPNIGVAGRYEVFEWHGALLGSQASECDYRIKYAGGTTTKKVNQQINQGQWNSLGIYKLNTGTSGNVTITSSGANGAVMADAIKFVFFDNEQSGDVTPPKPPANIRLGN